MRTLALDYGKVRCGVAVGSPEVPAHPLPPVERVGTGAGTAALLQLIEEHAVERIVVGLPLTLGGSEGPQTRDTRAFAGRLKVTLGLPLTLFDERLTTVQAQGAGAPAALKDSVAAALLLQCYLEQEQNRSAVR